MYSAHVLSSMLLFIGCIQSASSRAVIEILFMRYQASCTEDAGTRECDPKFTFCLKRDTDPMSISSCYYGSAGESSHYPDTNDIDFSYGKDVGGIPNPWIIPLTKDPGPKILFVIRIRDDDIFGDDHLQTWGTNLTEVVYPSKDVAVFSNRSTSSGGYTMKFRIRIYCDANYFSSNCSTYCKVQDSAAGHFSCDPVTGNKVCAKGWTGDNCTEDINECSQQICETGTCENLVGDYICHCPPHYTGKNCSSVDDICASDPCFNGATCVSSPNNTAFTCLCTYPFNGSLCESTTTSDFDKVNLTTTVQQNSSITAPPPTTRPGLTDSTSRPGLTDSTSWSGKTDGKRNWKNHHKGNHNKRNPLQGKAIKRTLISEKFLSYVFQQKEKPCSG